MSKKKVLIVEDDRDLRRALALRLVSLGYDVAQATDGYSALAVALKERPDVVLLDIGLPCGDGISVLQRYAETSAMCATPVVVLTGRDPFVTEPAVRQFNIAAFLRKPADNQQLADALAAAIDGADVSVAAPAAHTTGGPTGRVSSWVG